MSAQTTGPTALLGGRLIDCFGGTPLDHSVIIMEGDRIKAVGTVAHVHTYPLI